MSVYKNTKEVMKALLSGKKIYQKGYSGYVFLEDGNMVDNYGLSTYINLGMPLEPNEYYYDLEDLYTEDYILPEYEV